jgi:hypothetical protein
MVRNLAHGFFGNTRLKAWAMLLSLCIWFYAKSRLTEEMVVGGVIEVAAPPGYVLLYQSQNSARLRVAGPRSVLNRVRTDLAQGYVKLIHAMSEEEAAGGWATLRVTPEWLRTGLVERDFVQLSFRQFVPQELKVCVDSLKTRTLPVRFTPPGELAPGYRLSQLPSVSPTEVRVRGPALAVDALDSAAAEDLALYEPLAGDIRRTVGIRGEVEVALDNGERVPVTLDITPPTVTVTIYVTREEEVEDTYPNVPVLMMAPQGFPYEAQLASGERSVLVTVRATPAALKRLRPEAIRAYVELETLARAEIAPGASHPYQQEVRVLLPPDVPYSAARARPERVTLLLKNPAG